MSKVGDVLELMHTATLRPASVRGLLREWANLHLWGESARRYEELLPEGSFRRIGERNVERLPEIRDGTYRIRRRYPGNFWHIESTNYLGKNLVVRNEKTWWLSDSKGGLTTNERGAGRSPGLSFHGERFIELMLDPADVLAFTHIEVTGGPTYVGRPAYDVSATWRRDVDLFHVDLPYADSTRVLVDAEYGVLLLLEFYLDDTLFIRWQVDEVAFDEVMPDSMFEGI